MVLSSAQRWKTGDLEGTSVQEAIVKGRQARVNNGSRARRLLTPKSRQSLPLRRLRRRWDATSAMPSGVQAASMHVVAREKSQSLFPARRLWSSHFMGAGRSPFVLSQWYGKT
jgi:hypothetical protein